MRRSARRSGWQFCCDANYPPACNHLGLNMAEALKADEQSVIEIKVDVATDAFHEALRRFPDSHSALIFLWGASGLGWRNPTEEQLAWAREKMAARGSPN